jgi:hypothetical protein
LLKHFQQFGLLVHVGSLDADGNKTAPLETKAMYFPALPKEPDELATAKADLIFGDNNEFFIPFTDCFKYLVSCCIHESLRDNVEIDYHLSLQQATQQDTALQIFWNLTADLHTKQQMLLAIPVNTAFYGCKSWTLTTDLCRKISSFSTA